MGQAMSQLLDSLQSARLAAGRHAWREAYDDYSRVDAEELTAGDLERFGEAAWWSGRLEEAIPLRERAYAGYAGGGDKLNAATGAYPFLGSRWASRIRRLERLVRQRRALARGHAGVD